MDVSDESEKVVEYFMVPKEQMKIRGAADVQHSTMYKTPVYIEFVIKRAKEIYPHRKSSKTSLPDFKKMTNC
eukprot:13725367-Ditylum_brightwellii.AAC.1